MFVVTMKFNRKKAIWIIVAAAVLIAAIILLAGLGSRRDNIGENAGLFKSAGKLKTNDDRIKYLAELGWTAESEPTISRKVVLPTEFDDVLTTYNKLQLKQGFDLSKFAGKEIELYTYKITNYTGHDNVEATLLISNGKIVGGDVHSTALNGFMHGLK